MKATEGWQLANVIATITRVWSALVGIDARVIDVIIWIG
jgi:phenylpyruvate tautomerase PptA (4-oxalocrotonate tautomerase family)